MSQDLIQIVAKACQVAWQLFFIIIIIIIIYLFIYFYCNWVDARWQQYSTHLHTNSTHNTENRTYITIKNVKCGPCPVFASYILAFVLQLRKKHGKNLS
jgi:preprotein translocase subunit SecY